MISEAISLTENSGIIFIDEIDKIAGDRCLQGGGPEGPASHSRGFERYDQVRDGPPYVKRKLEDIIEDEDISRYIL